MKKRIIFAIVLVVALLSALAGCSRDIESITVKSLPTKQVYAVGESLDLLGGTIRVNYSDGKSSEVKMTSSAVSFEGFDSSTPGQKTVVVTYRGMTAEFTVTVKDAGNVVVTGMEIVKSPEKLVYNIGETLDLSGGTIIIIYSDGTFENFPMTHFSDVRGFDPEVWGWETVSILFGDFLVQFQVYTNPPPAVIGIEIADMPHKVVYESGEELDLTGGMIKLLFDNEASELIMMSDDRFTVEDFDAHMLGEQTLTVHYEAFFATFKVTVKEPLYIPTVEEFIEMLLAADEQYKLVAGKDKSDCTKFLISYMPLLACVNVLSPVVYAEYMNADADGVKASDIYEPIKAYYDARLGGLAGNAEFEAFLDAYTVVADRWFNDPVYKAGNADFDRDVPRLDKMFMALKTGAEQYGFFMLLNDGSHAYFFMQYNAFNEVMEEYYTTYIHDDDYEAYIYLRMLLETYVEYLFDADNLYWFLDIYWFYLPYYENLYYPALFNQYLGELFNFLESEYERLVYEFEFPEILVKIEEYFWYGLYEIYAMEDEIEEDATVFMFLYREILRMREEVMQSENANLILLYYEYRVFDGRYEYTLDYCISLLEEEYVYQMWGAVYYEVDEEFSAFFNYYLDIVTKIFSDGFDYFNYIPGNEEFDADALGLLEGFMELSSLAKRNFYWVLYQSYRLEIIFAQQDNIFNYIVNSYFEHYFSEAEINAYYAFMKATEMYVRFDINDTWGYDPTYDFADAIDALNAAYSALGENTATFDYYFGEYYEIYKEYYVPAVESISVETLPEKLDYFVGDALDLTGGSIKVLYKNGVEDCFSMSAEGVSVSPMTLTASGNIVITISYMGRTATFNVNVLKVEVVSLKIYRGPDKTVYNVGEYFSSEGMIFTVTYSNGVIKQCDAPMSGTSFGYDFSTPGEKEVIVRYNFGNNNWVDQDTCIVTVVDPAAVDMTGILKISELSVPAKTAMAKTDLTDFLILYRQIEVEVSVIMNSENDDLIAAYENYEVDGILLKTLVAELNTKYNASLGGMLDNTVFHSFLNSYLDVAEKKNADTGYKAGNEAFDTEIPVLYNKFFGLVNQGSAQYVFYKLLDTTLSLGGNDLSNFNNIFNNVVKEYYYSVLDSDGIELFDLLRTAESDYIYHLGGHSSALEMWFMSSMQECYWTYWYYGYNTDLFEQYLSNIFNFYNEVYEDNGGF